MTKSESERFNPSSASLVCLAVNLNHKFIVPNNRINSDLQFRCAPLPASYAKRYAHKKVALTATYKVRYIIHYMCEVPYEKNKSQ